MNVQLVNLHVNKDALTIQEAMNATVLMAIDYRKTVELVMVGVFKF